MILTDYLFPRVIRPSIIVSCSGADERPEMGTNTRTGVDCEGSLHACAAAAARAPANKRLNSGAGHIIIITEFSLFANICDAVVIVNETEVFYLWRGHQVNTYIMTFSRRHKQ